MTTTAPPQPRVWFITGASRGLGRAFTEAALTGGDRVIATARDVSPLDDLVATHDGALVTLPLDVSDHAAVVSTMDKAAAVFGGLDVVLNSAGQFLLGMIEETTEQQARAHLDTNFFGALWVAKAAIPHLRRRGGGRLLQVSSMGSVGGHASVGLYGAGKAALEAMTEALAMEVAQFGIAVTVLNAGGYDTGLFTKGLTNTEPDPAYADLRAELAAMWSEGASDDPAKAAAVVRDIVNMPEPPRRVILGGTSFDIVRDIARQRQADLERWEELSRAAGRG
ncbi:SDR family NAD(P)-dependent oxidoreductase [Saccharomonospora xinjiangensis]|uniref:SDR family NAD(P)-dependent oxidoreductase n=1 Tax=Saccharomonospora xinjiangensis TaxID=75294 RepID=UPI00106FB656|nr:SDR family NAD(P)-dependent oxidoreductase [Saccharomonospora xinjiangensis]QBQ60502.1 putative oxidoreductase [Saccharomonospora xinjiangensis]